MNVGVDSLFFVGARIGNVLETAGGQLEELSAGSRELLGHENGAPMANLALLQIGAVLGEGRSLHKILANGDQVFQFSLGSEQNEAFYASHDDHTKRIPSSTNSVSMGVDDTAAHAKQASRVFWLRKFLVN